MQFEREFGCSDSLDVVLSGVQQLETANLLVLTPREDASPFPCGPVMSRRSVVAAGSALVPVIASILVPTSAAAKSGSDKPGKSKIRGKSEQHRHHHE